MKYSLVSEGAVNYGEKLDSPSKMASYCRINYPVDYKIREAFISLYFDSDLRLLGSEIIGVGGLSSVVVDPRIIFTTALLTPRCTSLVLVHNHPSGNCRPSQNDVGVTRKLVDGAKLLDYKIIDHLIFGQKDHYSFAEQGELNYM